ncbi:MAG: hypothetical protein KC478_16920 [Bacteriovoracaceae bacterium]|nr:hypothetical protein [Bacteriovoracaceae bacterium]
MEESSKKNKAWEIHERELAFCCALLDLSKEAREKVAEHLERKLPNINNEVQAFKKIINGDVSDTGKTGSIRLEIKDKYLSGTAFDTEKAAEHVKSCIGEFTEDSKDEFRILACCCAIVSPQVEIKKILSEYLETKLQSFNQETTKFSTFIKNKTTDDSDLGKTDKKRFEIFKQHKDESNYKDALEVLFNKLKEIDPERKWGMVDILGVNKWLRSRDYVAAVDRYDSLCSRSFDRLLSDAFFEKFFMDTDGSPKKDFIFLEDNSSDEKELEEAVSNNMSLILAEGFDFENLPQVDPLELGSRVAKSITEFFDNMTNVRMRNMLFEQWEETHRSLIKQAKKIFRKEFDKVLDPEHFAVEIFGKDDFDRECIYCGLTESKTRFLKENDLLFTKKLYCKGATMEVDQKDAHKGYFPDNIVLACYWCNNAKTDEFDFDEWMKVGKVFKDIWIARKQSLIN